MPDQQNPAVELSDSPDPLVSVVTVSLNAVDSIEDTLASVHFQRAHFTFEHVCVDGGSRDGTRDLIDRWADGAKSIRRVYEPDTGIYDAMNKGLRAARGEYVLFLNADDCLVAADTLAQVFGGVVRGGDANPDLLLGDVLMGAPGKFGLWRRRRVPRLLGRVRGTGLFALHQGMFAKRALLNEVGGFDTRLRIAADINQFYDLERIFLPSMRFFGGDVAFMRAGGAANAGARAVWRGSVEIFRHLRPTHGTVRASGMVLVKTLQSVSEVRLGTPPYSRWFEEPLRAKRKSA